MGKKGKKDSSLGKTLIKDRFGSRKKTNDSFLHTSELHDGFDWNRINFASVTEETSLEEFLATAELAGTEFTAEKLNVSIVNSELYTGLLSAEQEKSVQEAQQVNRDLLKIPRRPAWDENTTAEDLDQRERDSFLEWRRNLALLQEKEHIVLTPFEKNLEFWRQLWRVIERSDLLVQIVDARNPLLYRSTDLEAYVKEVDNNKMNMILINKADHLTHQQRDYWAKYFDSVGMRIAFWSATMETERIKAMEKSEGNEHGDDSNDENEDIDSDEVDTDSDEGSNLDKLVNDETCQSDKLSSAVAENLVVDESSKVSNSNDQTERLTPKVVQESADTESSKTVTDSTNLQTEISTSEPKTEKHCDIQNSSRLLNGDELVDLFRSIYKGKQVHEDYLTVGFVGYPNVGKSSTINALIHTKKVSVSATPGHTKHFQTLFLDQDLMLCDCPGLVMPSFVSTKADLVISGILPIDQQRDIIPPISLVCRHIPKPVLEATYGIMLPKPKEGEDPNRAPTAYELLGIYGCMRGFMTHKGVPDMPRSARCILKDYVHGKLLYCHPPPDVSIETFVCAAAPSKPLRLKQEPLLMKRPKGAKLKTSKVYSDLDSQFFSKAQPRIGSKGVKGVINYSRLAGPTEHHAAGDPGSSSVHSSVQSLNEKPWKLHNNRGKKEKLRRKNAHLDAY